MSQAPHASATPPDGTALDRAAVDRDWAMLELETLHALARIGMAIAERLNQQHAAAVAATPPGAARAALHRDVGLAFMRISRAVRLTLAMCGRVREAREALAAGAVLPAAPVVSERPQPSAEAGQRAAAETARALARNPDELDLELEAEGDKPDDGPDPAERARGSNRPDRESLTELADFGFSLDRCRPGEVVARIYRGLGLLPAPVGRPQAWPYRVSAEAAGPAEAAGRPFATDRSKSTVLPRPAARGEVGSPKGFPGEGPALADGKGPHPRGVSSPEPLRVSGLSRKRDLFGTVFHPSAVIPAKAGISYRSIGYEIPAFAGMTNRGFLKRSRERERQPETCPLPSGPSEDSS